MKFRASLGAHEGLAHGRPLVPGEEISLSPEDQHDPHNTRLIAEGQLISISQSEKARADAESRTAPAPATVPITEPNPPEPNGGSS